MEKELINNLKKEMGYTEVKNNCCDCIHSNEKEKS